MYRARRRADRLDDLPGGVMARCQVAKFPSPAPAALAGGLIGCTGPRNHGTEPELCTQDLSREARATVAANSCQDGTVPKALDAHVPGSRSCHPCIYNFVPHATAK